MTVEAATLGPPPVVELSVFIITGNACWACGQRIHPGTPTVSAGIPALVAVRLHQSCRRDEEGDQ